MKWLQLINKSDRRKNTEMDPAAAYDAWSAIYDNESGNLMLDREEILFAELLAKNDLKNKVIMDVGCGTGRHWQKIREANLTRIIGFDVSAGMLSVLSKKFPGAETYLLNDHKLRHADDSLCDMLISTLALAHMTDIEKILTEWDRVVKPGGNILITDYHPSMFIKGADRSFELEGKTNRIINHIHPVNEVKKIFFNLNYSLVDFREEMLGELHRPYYSAKNALHIYERFKGTPFLYGMILRKNASY